MGKCWVIEEAEAEENIVIDPQFGPIIEIQGHMTEYPSNPLEPIREGWEKYKDRDFISADEGFILWQAIQKAMAIAEGK